MRYMLDTNICIYIIKKRPVSVAEKFRTLPVSQVGLSSVTVAELEYGVAKSLRTEENREALSAFLGPLKTAAFDNQAAYCYGVVRTSLEAQGRVIGAMDMLIAAHALSLSATLVTNNVREFSRVAGLSTENWITG